MKVRFCDLYASYKNLLKELFQKYSIMYTDGEMFDFSIDDDVLVLSTTDSVIVAIRTDEFFGLIKDYVVIDKDMFFYMEII